MTGSPSIPAGVSIDRLTSSADVVALTQRAEELDGTQPYVRSFQLDVACAPLDLIPEEATIERCVTTDTSVDVLARLGLGTVRIEATSTKTLVQVAAASHLQAEEVARALRAKAPQRNPEVVEIRMWHYNASCRTGIQSDRSIGAPAWDDISTNYPVAVRRSLDQLFRLERPQRAGKLVLWHGPPGTGKTTALRSLLKAWLPWCRAQYIADPERFFAEPSYLAQVLTAPCSPAAGPTLGQCRRDESMWRVVVAEDTDEYLRANARRDAGAALGRLLNVTDGILGQGINVIVLLTTNEEIGRLHPALVRPGRCLATIEFSPFSVEEAADWIGGTVDRQLTLADLLARRGDLSTLGTQADLLATTGQYL